MRGLRLATGSAICALVLIGTSDVPAASQAGREVRVATVVEGADEVTGIAFTSDGRLVFARRSGAVFIVQDGELRQKPIGTVPTSDEDGGILALAVGPEAETDTGVYVLAVAEDGEGSVVFRIALDLQAAPEIVVDDLPAASGALAFTDDGTLLVAGGADLLELSDPSHVSEATAEPVDGLRDARGLAVEPGRGRPVLVDASGTLLLDGDRSRTLGFRPGAAAFGDARAPEPYAGGLFIAARGRSEIHLVGIDPTDGSDEVVVDAGGPVLTLAWGPAGLYFSTQERISVALMARDVRPDPAVTVEGDAAPGGALAPRNRWFFVLVTLAFVAAYFYGRRRLLR